MPFCSLLLKPFRYVGVYIMMVESLTSSMCVLYLKLSNTLRFRTSCFLVLLDHSLSGRIEYLLSKIAHPTLTFIRTSSVHTFFGQFFLWCTRGTISCNKCEAKRLQIYGTSTSTFCSQTTKMHREYNRKRRPSPLVNVVDNLSSSIYS